MSDEVRRHDPVGVLSAFGRAAYSNLVTIVVVSVVTALAAIPVVTLGPALTGTVAALTTAVDAELAGERRTERQRMRRFVDAARENLWRTLPFGFIPLGAIAASLWYLNVAFTTGSSSFLVAASFGVYVVVASFVWVLRAASLIVRSDDENPPGTREALRDAGHHLLDAPRFSALQSVAAGVVLAFCLALGVSVFLLLTGLLATLEVVCFEEREGDGAVAVVRAYQGRLHPGEDT